MFDTLLRSRMCPVGEKAEIEICESDQWVAGVRSANFSLAMAEEAIRAVLAYRKDHGIPISGDAQPQLRKITVAA